MKPTAEALSLAGDIYLGRLYSEMDCQAFVERCLKDIGINTNLTGSNAWYRYMTWVGTPEECIAKFGSIPNGAFLYILSSNSKEPEKYKADGIGNASHIGIKTGRKQNEMLQAGLNKIATDCGDDKDKCAELQRTFTKIAANGSGAIHSSSSKAHVVTSNFADKTIKNGGWNRIGLWDKLDYGEKINSILSGKVVNVVVEYAKVTGGGLNMRESMSTSAARITLIPDGSTVAVLEQNDNWCKVTYNNYTGYVMKAYLSFDNSDSGEKTSKIMLSLPRDCAQALYEALKYSLKL